MFRNNSLLRETYLIRDNSLLREYMIEGDILVRNNFLIERYLVWDFLVQDNFLPKDSLLNALPIDIHQGKSLESMDTEPEVIIQENNCLVYIYRNWVSNANDLFQTLVDTLPWEQADIIMRGKSVPEPRLSCAFSDGEIQRYSGQGRTMLPWTEELMQIRKEIQFVAPFNSCLANYYREGKDYIGYHRDKEIRGGYLVSLSLGGSRDFYFRRLSDKMVIKCKLNSGDLCVITGLTNSLYEHSIPKRAKGDPRISLTFRVL